MLDSIVIDLILKFYNKDIFKNKLSVMDMGDQDLGGDFQELKDKFEKQNIYFNEKNFSQSKNFPKRPRASSSVFWKQLGFKTTHRLDLFKLDRDKNDPGKCFVFDLNNPLLDASLINKYDLVTDFGNNEHPFNIAETYNTMHKLCKKEGLMIICQGFLNGNGFFLFDDFTIDSIAASNSYSVINSCFIIKSKELFFTLPAEKKYLKGLNLNEIDSINLFYILRKNKDEKFRFPYQGLGKKPSKDELFSSQVLNTSTKTPEQIYLPTHIDQIQTSKILKSFLKRILRKIGLK